MSNYRPGAGTGGDGGDGGDSGYGGQGNPGGNNGSRDRGGAGGAGGVGGNMVIWDKGPAPLVQPTSPEGTTADWGYSGAAGKDGYP